MLCNFIIVNCENTISLSFIMILIDIIFNFININELSQFGFRSSVNNLKQRRFPIVNLDLNNSCQFAF